MRLAHIDEHEGLALVHHLLHFRRRDLGDFGFGHVFLPTDSAELFVVNQLGHARMRSAHRAFGVLAQLELAELQIERVKQQQPPDERPAPAEDQLDGLERLDRAHDSRQHAQHASLGATRHHPRRRRLGIEAPVARAFLRIKHRGLPLEAEDAAVDVGLAQEHAGVVHEVSRGEIVRPVGHDVVVAEDVERVLRRQARLVRDHFDVRVDVGNRVLRRLDLQPAHVARIVDDLPLQVGEIDHVEIDDAQPADARRREIQRQGRA